MIFDNTGTGGEGVSAVVAQVQGETANSLAMAVGATSDVYTATINTAGFHYLQPGDAINVSVEDNVYTRIIKSKIINSKYHFNYFGVSSMKLIAAYANTTAYTQGDLIYVADRVYQAALSGTSSSTAPTHESGTLTDGSMPWTYLRNVQMVI